MSVLHWVDNRTLVGCQVLLATIYTVFLFGMRHLYHRLRGTGALASSYLLATLGGCLVVARDSIPYFVSVVIASALLFASNLLFLRGIQRFFQVKKVKKTTYLAYGWSILALLLVTYFTLVHDNIVPRNAISGFNIFLLRGMVAIELYRQSSGKPIIRFYSYMTGTYAIFGLTRAILTLAFGAPTNVMQYDSLQTLSLVINIVFVCSLGLLLLFMLSSELLIMVQDESQQDPLTGILNRRGVDLKLALELKRIARSGQNLSIAFIDVDHFKSVNDASGHAGGDEALRQVATTISSRLRAYDLLGRYGGDEFLLVLPQTSWSDTLIVCERLEQAIRKLVIPSSNITISTGITQAVPGELILSLLARADKALYIAKRSGRNQCRVTLHDPSNRSTHPTDSRSYITIPREDQTSTNSAPPAASAPHNNLVPR